MKKATYLSILFLIIGTISLASEGNLSLANNLMPPPDSSVTKKLKRSGCEDCFVFDLVYNDWYGDRGSFSSPAASIGFNFAFIKHWDITKNGALSIGAGLEFSHYNNKTYTHYKRDFEKGFTVLEEYIAGEDDNPDKVRYNANYLEIPVDFRFITKGKQHFKIMVGGKIGVTLNASNKLITTRHGHKYKVKKSNFPDLNRWRYGVFAKIGIRNITLFGAYYFSPLFKSDKSTQLYPISMGISVSIW